MDFGSLPRTPPSFVDPVVEMDADPHWEAASKPATRQSVNKAASRTSQTAQNANYAKQDQVRTSPNQTRIVMPG